VCDARFRDELVQRIGRAGRILGKRGVEIPSRAVVLLTDDAAQALAELDGQILERSEFAAVLVQALPAKHQLDGYIRSYAMQELIWPIYKLRQMMTEDGWRELEVLYARLCDAFAPHFRRREKSLLGYARKYEERRRWLNAAQTGKNQAPDKTEIHLYDWLIWQMPEAAVPEPAALRSWVATQWRNNQQRQEIIAFVQSQVALTQALFSFREAFQGPAIGIFDPKHLFSSETVNVYDVFHLLSHYHLSDLINAAAFRKLSGEEIPDADFYCQLLAQRDQPLSIEFALSTNLERQLFDSRWTGLPVAVTGLQLQARIPKGDVVTGGIPYPIAQALAKQPVVMLIVPPDLGYARTKFEGTEIWSRRLTVNFDATGEQVDSYLVFLGTAAFEAHAELEQVFRRWQQQRYCHQAIIL
jgi:CRISPR-associated endonuclease/helicase Cas3